MRIPEIQERLRELATTVASIATEIDNLTSELSRRPAIRVGRRDSAKMTDALRVEIKSMAERDPWLTQKAIANKLNISSGRVSETLAGKRA